MKEISQLHTLYIDGKEVSSSSFIDVYNPYDGDLIGKAPHATPTQVEQAISSAHLAYERNKQMAPQERRKLLMALADKVRSHRDDYAKLITLEAGKALKEAYGEVDYACSFLDWFAEEAVRVYGHIIESNEPNQKIWATKEPVGVVAAITPWNFPLAMITRKIAPALAVGCSVVLKAAELTPFCAYALGDHMREVGFPPGMVNIITGDPSEIGQAFCRDKRVRKLSFTGSTRVGKILYAQCADQIKKLSLELGGNAPFIVTKSANIADAVKGAVAIKLRNASQSCICANRFFVHSDCYDEFSTKFTEAFSGITIGNGMEDPDMGPMITKESTERLLKLIDNTVAEGGDLLCGGKVQGRCIQPTVLGNVNQSMAIANQEIFGPVAPLIRYTFEEELIEWANDTPYGLASYLYSNNTGEIMRISRVLEYGMVGINEVQISRAATPFGGVKESGLGIEGSLYGIDDYLVVKSITMNY